LIRNFFKGSENFLQTNKITSTDIIQTVLFHICSTMYQCYFSLYFLCDLYSSF